MTINYTTGRRLVLAIDGACLGNPGPGGWAVIIHEMDGDTIISRSALAGRADGDTTNNRMEMTAAYEALRYLGADHTPATIVSDSQILVNGMTQWRDGWKANGWRKADRKPVLNLDLWMALDELCPKSRPIRWEWTRGHSGHPMNEMADMLANDAAAGIHRGELDELRRLYPGSFSSEGDLYR